VAQWVSGGQGLPSLCASRAGDQMCTSGGSGSGVSRFLGAKMVEMDRAGDAIN